MIHINHPNNIDHEGVVIIVKSFFKFDPCPQFKGNVLQFVVIQITLNHILIPVAFAYCPSKRHNIYFTIFEEYFSTLGRNFIFGGGLNAENIN